MALLKGHFLKVGRFVAIRYLPQFTEHTTEEVGVVNVIPWLWGAPGAVGVPEIGATELPEKIGLLETISATLWGLEA